MRLKCLLLLFAFVTNLAYAQFVDKDYLKKEYNKSTLIIAPIVSIDSAEMSFKTQFAEITNPVDSMKKFIEKNLQFTMRKYAAFRGLYSSVYEDYPLLIKRTLALAKGDSAKIALPVDGQKVKMVLKGPNPKQDPDFILFLQIKSFGFSKLTQEYTTVISKDGKMKIPADVNEEISDMKYINWTKTGGITVNDFCWVLWDNKNGKITAYNKASGLFGEDATFSTANVFSERSQFLDLACRFILTKTPFSKADMPYYILGKHRPHPFGKD